MNFDRPDALVQFSYGCHIVISKWKAEYINNETCAYVVVLAIISLQLIKTLMHVAEKYHLQASTY